MNVYRLCLIVLFIPPFALSKSISHLEARVVVLNDDLLEPSATIVPTVGLVPGHLFGVPDESVFPVSGTRVTEVSLPLIYLLKAFYSLSQSSTDPRLSVHPPNTRFGRISTGASAVGSQVYRIGGTFMNKAENLDLVLVYVEGPCTITGDIGAVGESFRIDLTFKTSGFHWVSIDQSGYVLNTDIDEPVVFQLFGAPPPSE